jgi:hypothetical protein
MKRAEAAEAASKDLKFNIASDVVLCHRRRTKNKNERVERNSRSERTGTLVNHSGKKGER